MSTLGFVLIFIGLIAAGTGTLIVEVNAGWNVGLIALYAAPGVLIVALGLALALWG